MSEKLKEIEQLVCKRPNLDFTVGKTYEAVANIDPPGWLVINDKGKEINFFFTGVVFDRPLRQPKFTIEGDFIAEP